MRYGENPKPTTSSVVKPDEKISSILPVYLSIEWGGRLIPWKLELKNKRSVRISVTLPISLCFALLSNYLTRSCIITDGQQTHATKPKQTTGEHVYWKKSIHEALSTTLSPLGNNHRQRDVRHRRDGQTCNQPTSAWFVYICVYICVCVFILQSCYCCCYCCCCSVYFPKLAAIVPMWKRYTHPIHYDDEGLRTLWEEFPIN
ncbi:hypothetical protein Kpol_1002p22 [Vanderwaltozyma polyspora DSM 70294]|uniref:Uncharacterized protein n=1 Tax=Vanderwaltozyma polyspora (strain ATCC 22028 / DSM 70294 / BCRC 21397 / CBS 2163 / NBRC 10782 / NRRL Y-8283 / UCD 57-17) TaxID=436907 RepID=A7TE54_VANPO|nr:uncharacterized protein Kpol_1002p22 [Vanderwaltozyma polyspora DSM 70294]EDO19376.1 hypothetical protein Kpol_1002p22 [Vanderwaltozyma polyspora DSM 70294]